MAATDCRSSTSPLQTNPKLSRRFAVPASVSNSTPCSQAGANSGGCWGGCGTIRSPSVDGINICLYSQHKRGKPSYLFEKRLLCDRVSVGSVIPLNKRTSGSLQESCQDPDRCVGWRELSLNRPSRIRRHDRFASSILEFRRGMRCSSF